MLVISSFQVLLQPQEVTKVINVCGLLSRFRRDYWDFLFIYEPNISFKRTHIQVWMEVSLPYANGLLVMTLTWLNRMEIGRRGWFNVQWLGEALLD